MTSVSEQEGRSVVIRRKGCTYQLRFIICTSKTSDKRSLTMLHRGNNTTELKYVGIVVVLCTLFQLAITEQTWKDIVFVIQFIFVELFLVLSFQELASNLNNRVIELKRLNSLTQTTNMRLIRDVVSLKGIMKELYVPRKETRYENTNRVVMDALKSNTPAKKGRKLVAKHNRKNRVKPYVVKNVNDMPKPVEIERQEPIYVKMRANTADQPRQDSPVRRDEISPNVREENDNVINIAESTQLLEDSHDQAFENMVKEQQYFCTRKVINGRNVYERLCLNCSGVMEQKGHPIFSKICQSCKPIRGQNITHYKRLSKFDNLIEYYCGCAMCFISEDPPCLQEYCQLCTVPRLTRKLNKERAPVAAYKEWNGIE